MVISTSVRYVLFIAIFAYIYAGNMLRVTAKSYTWPTPVFDYYGEFISESFVLKNISVNSPE